LKRLIFITSLLFEISQFCYAEAITLLITLIGELPLSVLRLHTEF